MRASARDGWGVRRKGDHPTRLSLRSSHPPHQGEGEKVTACLIASRSPSGANPETRRATLWNRDSGSDRRETIGNSRHNAAHAPPANATVSFLIGDCPPFLELGIERPLNHAIHAAKFRFRVHGGPCNGIAAGCTGRIP